MEITVSIILFIAGTLINVCLFFIWRNNKVLKYRLDLIDRVYCKKIKLINSNLEDIFTYDDIVVGDNNMLLKFWIPLKDEYWLTEEQIEYLKN